MTADLYAETYYVHRRDDILRHVPQGVRRVLSVGCGAGRTEAELVRSGVSVTGIEIDGKAAAEARGNGLEILEGDAAAMSGQLSGESFDCLIYADVLEHLVDPVNLLRSHVRLLRSGGSAIISIPNFRHVTVFVQMFLLGRIKYTNAGILDRTHVRLTTRRLVEDWLREVGLRPISAEYRMSQRREKWIAACSFGMAREFVARQVIVTARKD